MAVTSSIQMIGDKAVVGALDVSFLPGVPILPGTFVANGPAYFGAGVPVPTAGVMIGPPINLPVPVSLEVKGVANIFGILNVIAVSNFTGLCTKFGVTIRNSASITNGINTKNALNLGNAPSVFNGSTTTMGASIVNGKILCGGNISCATIRAARGEFGSVAAPFKFFDIPHPSKEFPHRLRYSCLEGPEIGVYFRGELQGTNEIELPDYWKDLVDDRTITVHLTPIGSHQNLCYAIARMKDKTSILVNPHGFNTHTIRCSYIVHAERKDVKKLVTEYEGATE